MSEMNLESVLQTSQNVIGLAASFIKSQIDQVRLKDIEVKELNSLVSYVDINAEKILIKGLNPLIEQAGFITEENTIESSNKTYTWIIDPLDGTTNFLHRVPHFSISVALQYKNQTILGIVHEVNSGEVWSAIKGEGAYLNGNRIKVNQSKLKDILVATGFPYSNDHDYNSFFEVLKHWLTKTRGMRRMGSAALDLCYVACGRFGAYYESSLNSWDVAAGAIIVEEAGGRISDYSGGCNYLYGREIIASNALVHDEVINIIQPILKRNK